LLKGICEKALGEKIRIIDKMATDDKPNLKTILRK
jgi:hypothetical protein